jgi:predicted NAD/FAD-binding protein
LHGLPKLLDAHAFTLADKIALGRAFSALMRPVPSDSTESLGAWLRRHGQNEGALNRFWRLVIASALNADIDSIALPYAAKVIRELFMNSADAGSMGMSTRAAERVVCGCDSLSEERGGSVHLNTHLWRARRGMRGAQWTIKTRSGELTSDLSLWRCRLRRLRSCCHICPRRRAQEKLAAADCAARALAHLQRASVV